MPTTTAFEFGSVVLVPFPFTDQTTTKKRPAVVVSSDAYHREQPDIIIMAITSQLRPAAAFGDATIDDWQGAGLLKPSVLKPLLATLERRLVLRTLGQLKAPDRTAASELLSAILGR